MSTKPNAEKPCKTCTPSHTPKPAPAAKPTHAKPATPPKK